MAAKHVDHPSRRSRRPLGTRLLVRGTLQGIAHMERSYGERGAKPFDMAASALNPVGLQVVDFTNL